MTIVHYGAVLLTTTVHSDMYCTLLYCDNIAHCTFAPYRTVQSHPIDASMRQYYTAGIPAFGYTLPGAPGNFPFWGIVMETKKLSVLSSRAFDATRDHGSHWERTGVDTGAPMLMLDVPTGLDKPNGQSHRAIGFVLDAPMVVGAILGGLTSAGQSTLPTSECRLHVLAMLGARSSLERAMLANGVTIANFTELKFLTYPDAAKHLRTAGKSQSKLANGVRELLKQYGWIF